MSWAIVGASRGCARRRPTWTGLRPRAFGSAKHSLSVPLFTEPCGVPHRSLQSPQRHRQQSYVVSACQRDLRDALVRRGLSYRLFRQVAHGDQRERPGFDRYASYVGQGQCNNAIFLVNGVKTSSVGWVDESLPRTRSSSCVPMPPGRFSPSSVSSRPTLRTRRPRGSTACSPRPCSPHRRTRPATRPTTRRPCLRHVDGDGAGLFPHPGGCRPEHRASLRAIDQIGVTNDTVVVFASDNGFFLREHGIPEGQDGNKRNAYEESIRIPLLLHYARLARRGVLRYAGTQHRLGPNPAGLVGHARPTSSKAAAGCRYLPGS